jgi:3-oxoacyl-[acyl-carrier-protein] synthase-3
MWYTAFAVGDRASFSPHLGDLRRVGTRILGWGSALPDKILSNADLEARLDTSDDWIVSRTGIRERRIGDSTSALASAAGGAALRHANVDPASIDLLILCTTTPDQTVPASCARVHHELGLGGGAFDLNGACAGFVNGLITANGLLSAGMGRVLLVAAETLSRITDPNDRNTAVLFGDGAGAFVLECCDEPSQLLSWDLGMEGNAGHILYADVGGTLKMDGKEVFRRAVGVLTRSANQALENAGCSAADVSLLVPHQANIRIIRAACDRLGIPYERTAIVLDRTGNTSSASIPLALIDAAEQGRLETGDLVLLAGFGAGMTWGSALLRWGEPDEYNLSGARGG